MLVAGGFVVPFPHSKVQRWYADQFSGIQAGDPGRRQKPRRDRGNGAGRTPGRKEVELTLSEDLWRFCRRYAARKNLTVDALLTMLVTQGLLATVEALEA